MRLLCMALGYRRRVFSETMQLVTVTPDFAAARARWDGMTDRERAAFIVAAITAAGINKTELADRLGLKYGSVHAWTTGDSECDWARWMAIAVAVDFTPTWEPAPLVLAKAQREVDALRPAPKKRKRTKPA